MKYLLSINEFNNIDKNILLSDKINNSFTIAYEFELESDDKKLKQSDTESEVLDKFRAHLIDIFKNIEIIDNLLEFVNFDDFDSSIDSLVAQGNTQLEINIAYEIIDLIEKYEDDKEEIVSLDYAKNMVKEYLPNFHKKYSKILKFEFDLSLSAGIEFSPKKYLNSLTEGINMIDSFFDDFKKQNYWKMKNTTSIHINLGFKQDVKWNIIKGLVMLGEIKKDEIPFVYRGIESRVNTNFTKSLLKMLYDIDDIYDMSSITSMEEQLLKNIDISVEEFGSKTFAVNINNIKEHDYIEFRHVGGDVDKEILIDKTMYFAYIAYMMTTEHNDKKYHNKLYKFVEKLNEMK